MRTITNQAVRNFLNAEKFNKSNTSVKVLPNVTVLCLHGNEIAYIYNDPQKTLSITTRGWNTRTTLDRLNGIPGVSINVKNGTMFLNGTEWNGTLIDVK